MHVLTGLDRVDFVVLVRRILGVVEVKEIAEAAIASMIADDKWLDGGDDEDVLARLPLAVWLLTTVAIAASVKAPRTDAGDEDAGGSEAHEHVGSEVLPHLGASSRHEALADLVEAVGRLVAVVVTHCSELKLLM